ncbi:dihydroorotate dehydrogenase electron transfer subunit [Piscibacillus salipiscarius]|nr:dihydroorotate dehydrogenase electron transfer subunit [Piscibacillus salipiscarius]
MLRRPISIADYDKQINQLTIIYKVFGEGTDWLARQLPGGQINVLGPLGNGFDLSGIQGQTVIVIGGGVGVPPLYNLVKQLNSQFNDVTAILGYQSKVSIFYEKEFKDLTQTYIATDDGTYGYDGLVTDVIRELRFSYDHYFSCGPTGMLKAVQHQLSDIDGYISIEERMGCGVGACFACVCQADNDKGYVKICQDGPVFHAKEVTL